MVLGGLEDPVELREKPGRMVIEPVRHKEFNLAEVRGKLRALLGR